MKDFRLSEVKAHCDKMFEEYGEQACEKCGETEIGKICLGHFKNGVSGLPDVEPRDMIELPCKIKVAYLDDVFAWQVLRRNKNGDVETVNDIFGTEADADAFLANLKGGKK